MMLWMLHTRHLPHLLPSDSVRPVFTTQVHMQPKNDGREPKPPNHQQKQTKGARFLYYMYLMMFSPVL